MEKMDLSSVRPGERTYTESTAELQHSSFPEDGSVGQYGCSQAGCELMSRSHKKEEYIMLLCMNWLLPYQTQRNHLCSVYTALF